MELNESEEFMKENIEFLQSLQDKFPINLELLSKTSKLLEKWKHVLEIKFSDQTGNLGKTSMHSQQRFRCDSVSNFSTNTFSISEHTYNNTNYTEVRLTSCKDNNEITEPVFNSLKEKTESHKSFYPRSYSIENSYPKLSDDKVIYVNTKERANDHKIKPRNNIKDPSVYENQLQVQASKQNDDKTSKTISRSKSIECVNILSVPKLPNRVHTPELKRELPKYVNITAYERVNPNETKTHFNDYYNQIDCQTMLYTAQMKCSNQKLSKSFEPEIGPKISETNYSTDGNTIIYGHINPENNQNYEYADISYSIINMQRLIEQHTEIKVINNPQSLVNKGLLKRTLKSYMSTKSPVFFEMISNHAIFFVWFMEFDILLQEVINLNEPLYLALENSFSKLFKTANFRQAKVEAGLNYGFNEVFNSTKNKSLSTKTMTIKLSIKDSLRAQGLSNGVLLYVRAPDLLPCSSDINLQLSENIYKEFNMVDNNLKLMRAMFPIIFGVRPVLTRKIPNIASMLSNIFSIDYKTFIPSELENITFVNSVANQYNEYHYVHKSELEEKFIALANSDNLNKTLNFPVKLSEKGMEMDHVCGVGVNKFYLYPVNEGPIKVENEYGYREVYKWGKSMKGISIHLHDQPKLTLVPEENDEVFQKLVKFRIQRFFK